MTRALPEVLYGLRQVRCGQRRERGIVTVILEPGEGPRLPIDEDLDLLGLEIGDGSCSPCR